MRRMNLRAVPDDVYETLAAAAESHRQSLSAYVVDRLAEIARAETVADYVASYPEPTDTGIGIDDAVADVREVREAS